MSCRYWSVGLSLGALVVALTPFAHAADVRYESSTVLGVREIPRGNDAVSSAPLYEHLSLRLSDIDPPGMHDSRLVVRTWARWQLGADPLLDERADVALAFFETRTGNLTLRLGRQHLPQGVGRMAMLDGLNAHASLPGGLALEGFVGGTVHPQLRFQRDDWQTGGRLSWRLPRVVLRELGPGELGVSYRQVRDEGWVSREEVGVDGFVQLARTRLVGFASVQPHTGLLHEGRLALTWSDGPWTATLEGERTTPALFLPATSVLSVFSETSHDAMGGDVEWDLSKYTVLTATAHGLLRNEDWRGYRASVEAITYRSEARRSLVGVQLSRLDDDDSGYWRGRLFTGLQLTESFRLATDGFIYALDEPIRDRSFSALVQGSGAWLLSDKARISVSVAGGATPFARYQIEGMLRLAYGRTAGLPRGSRP